MRAIALIALVVSSAGHAQTAFGGNASLLAHQEAAGTYRVTASPQLRFARQVNSFLFVSAVYGFAYFPSSSSYGVQVAAHDISARAVGRIALPKSFLDIELGPVLKINHSTNFVSGAAADSQVRFAPAGVGGLYLAVPIKQLEFRAGTDFEFNGRLGLRFSFGLMWWLS